MKRYLSYSNGQGLRCDFGPLIVIRWTYNQHRFYLYVSPRADKSRKTRIDNKILLTILHTLVFNKLYYCSNVWANPSRNNIQKLQAVQNFACRITSGTRKYDHITPFLKELRWLRVASELLYCRALMAFKYKLGCAPEYLPSQFIQRAEVSNRRTGNSQKLNIPLFKQQVDKELFITEL